MCPRVQRSVNGTFADSVLIEQVSSVASSSKCFGYTLRHVGNQASGWQSSITLATEHHVGDRAPRGRLSITLIWTLLPKHWSPDIYSSDELGFALC